MKVMMQDPSIHKNGMFNINFLLKENPDGSVIMHTFLVDVWCLGVKDSAILLVPKHRYEEYMDKFYQQGPIIEENPAYARAFIEHAVEYAKGIGILPAKSYKKTKKIFSRIDDYKDFEYQFGHNGKPHYMSGPNDTPQFVARVLRTLEHKLGKDNYHFTVMDNQLNTNMPVKSLF